MSASDDCAPGNAGIAAQLAPRLPGRRPPTSTACVDLARREAVDLTVVGPEAPLERGLADRFAAAGLVSSARPEAARLETSKAFAKPLMALAGCPPPATGSPSRPEARDRRGRGAAAAPWP